MMNILDILSSLPACNHAVRERQRHHRRVVTTCRIHPPYLQNKPQQCKLDMNPSLPSSFSSFFFSFSFFFPFSFLFSHKINYLFPTVTPLPFPTLVRTRTRTSPFWYGAVASFGNLNWIYGMMKIKTKYQDIILDFSYFKSSEYYDNKINSSMVRALFPQRILLQPIYLIPPRHFCFVLPSA